MANKNLLRFYFSFEGRATRWDFNIRYALVAFLGGIAAFAVDYMMVGSAAFAPGAPNVFYSIWSVLAFIAGLAVTCRRLHDMDYSGWWQVGVYIIPAIMLAIAVAVMGLSFITNPLAAGIGGIVAVLAVLIAYLFYFIFLSAKRGTTGPNQYGADPLQIETVETNA